MPRIKSAVALPNFRVALAFSDGVNGEVDLSPLKGKGVFAYWDQPGAFESMEVGSAGELKWGDQLDLCPDSLYLDVTKKSPEDLFPALKNPPAHA